MMLVHILQHILAKKLNKIEQWNSLYVMNLVL